MEYRYSAIDILKGGDNMGIKQNRTLILEGNMKRVILTLALPVMANNFIQTIYNLTDTYFVSKLGTTEIAAIQFVWPMIFFMMSLGAGVSIAGTSLISQYSGAADDEMAKKVSGQVITFSVVFSIILGIIGFIITPPLLKIMGATDDFYIYASDFLRLMFIGGPTMFMMFAYSAIRNGLGDTYRPMKIGGLSVLSNIILDPIFIFTLGLGIKGAALATIIARGTFGIYSIWTLFEKNSDFKIEKKHLFIDKNLMLELLKIGIPSSVGQSMTSVGFMVLNIFIISFGEATLTAFAIGNQINGLVLMPAMGIGSALTTVVGQNLGADNIDRAKKAVKTSMIMATLFLSIGGLPLIYFAEEVIGLFTTDLEVLRQGTYYLILITLSIPLMGVFQVFVGTLQGAGKTLYSMGLMTARLWLIRLPLVILFKNYTNLGETSVWYSMIISNFIVCILGYMIYKSGVWEKKRIESKFAPA